MPSKPKNPNKGYDEASFMTDLHSLFEAHARGLDPVNVTLPSGRFLHNPAKKKVKDSSRWVDQQVRHAKSASADWLEGIKNPRRDPIQAALDKKEKFLDRLKAALDAGKWEKNLKKSSLAEIVEIATKVGTGAYETGIEARLGKITRVVNELQPKVQAVSDAIQALPDKTDSDRANRLLAARKAMIEVGRTR
jgi:hypothetical protein